jgi:hypothetical protein
MRPLAALVLLAFAAPAPAADKNEEKAKEAAFAFLKAVKAKDADAVMKVVGVPFTFGGKTEAVTKREELRPQVVEWLKEVSPNKVPDAVGRVLDLPTARKILEAKKEDERSRGDVAALKVAENVKGDAVLFVVLNKGGFTQASVLVRLQRGAASVVWTSE